MSGFSFAVGKKKTPFQRHKELEEEKKKKEADEAAKLYEDFVESFAEDPADKGPKAFVRGEVIQPGQRPPDSGEQPRRAGKYVPKFLPPSMAAAFATPEAKPQSLESMLPLPKPAAGSKGKPRQIDAVLDNLKREQERRDERQRMRKETGGALDPLDEEGSFDDGDPYTTNLYIGNLSTDVDEEVLKKEFGRFGPLASVKIMWPRDDDQRRRGRNCGFVAYMTREEAQRAKDDLNGIMLHDNDLRIGWGKSIPIPAAPMFVLNPPGGVAPTRGAAIAPPGQSPALAPWGALQTQQPTVPDIEVQFPRDARTRYIIDTMALYVLQDGCSFEQAVMLKEQANPEFAFLFDLKSPEHVYYRWRLYSLANEDSLMRWHVEPFWLVEETARWIPPAMTLAGSSHQTAAQRGGEAKDKDKPLSDMQRDRFEDILRGLTVERKDICDAMIFALDNADSAFEIVEILTDALTLPETPIPTKVARLFLTSDVLHNSTAPVRNASVYRKHLETALPDIFESLQEAYRGCDSRMAQEVLRRHVLRVLRMWRSWSIFSDDFFNGLQATFLRGTSALAAGKRESSAAATELEELDDELLETRCRRNGLSKKGGRDMQIQRLLELQSYLNGGISDWPAQMAEPLIKQEAQQHDNHLGSISPSDQQAPAGLSQLSTAAFTRTTATPVSQWTVAEDPDADQPTIAVSKWVAQEAALQSQAAAAVAAQEEEALPPLPVEAPPRRPSTAPVSKWTLVDYDEDNPPTDLEGQEGTDIFSGVGGNTPIVEGDSAEGTPPRPPSAEEGRAGKPSTPLDPPGPSRKATELRNDAAEEGRRQKLRQVELAVMMFREQLEEDSGGKTKAQVDAEVSEHRARLIADAEESNKAEPSKSDSKSGRTRVADKGKLRDADKPKDTVDKIKRQGKSDTKSSSKETRSSKHNAPKDEPKLSRRESDHGKKRRRSRSRSSSSSRGRSPSRSRSRDRHQGRREEKSRKSSAKERESAKEERSSKGKSRSDRNRSLSRSPQRSSRSKTKQRERDDRDTKKKRDRSRSKSRDRRRSRSCSRSRDRDRKARKR